MNNYIIIIIIIIIDNNNIINDNNNNNNSDLGYDRGAKYSDEDNNSYNTQILFYTF